MIPVSEAQSQRAVADLFRLYGWEVRRMEEDWHNGDGRGIPDLLCTSPHGLQLWIEIKRPMSSRNPKGRVRAAQKALLTEWRRRGVLCCVADGWSRDLEAIAQENPSLYLELPDYCDALMSAYDWWPA